MTTTDWNAWHAPYDDAQSPLSRRRRIIQGHLRDWLDQTQPRDVRVVSVCAGDGSDLIGVLRDRRDTGRVQGVLVELDPTLAASARERLVASALTRIEVRETDAGASAVLLAAGPADLLLLAGVFGNISDADVHATITALPQLCASGGRVIWTRHRREPDLTGSIRSWFRQAGFTECDFRAPPDAIFTVGVCDYTGRRGAPAPLPDRLFRFNR